MGQALYRKYRSKNFSEVIGQDNVTQTLQKALNGGRISHAYLFTGPRGVGKTSVARILAHEVNGLKNSGEAPHLDIIEIDAASNRRIDEIRDLRERVHIAPAAAKYKVYIIDEVHMLTKEAFNALLKTLEEPPSHVIFILATTEAHKLPETIISRTQRFSFKPVDEAVIVKHLEQLARKEKLEVTRGALEIIADHSDGSVRDSVSLLDQLAASGKKIDEAAVRQILGVPKSQSVARLLDGVSSGQAADIISTLEELQEQGINPAIIAKELSQLLRQQLIAGSSTAWLPQLLRRLLDVSASSHPKDELEISLLEAASLATPMGHRQTTAKTASAKTTAAKSITDRVKMPTTAVAFSLDMWPKVLDDLKRSGHPCYSALRLAKPAITDDILTLSFQFSLHHKKVDVVKNKTEIAKVVESVCGQRLVVDCVVDKALFKKTKPIGVAARKSQSSSAPGHLEAISNIFGPAEMLES